MIYKPEDIGDGQPVTCELGYADDDYVTCVVEGLLIFDWDEYGNQEQWFLLHNNFGYDGAYPASGTLSYECSWSLNELDYGDSRNLQPLRIGMAKRFVRKHSMTR